MLTKNEKKVEFFNHKLYVELTEKNLLDYYRHILLALGLRHCKCKELTFAGAFFRRYNKDDLTRTPRVPAHTCVSFTYTRKRWEALVLWYVGNAEYC